MVDEPPTRSAHPAISVNGRSGAGDKHQEQQKEDAEAHLERASRVQQVAGQMGERGTGRGLRLPTVMARHWRRRTGLDYAPRTWGRARDGRCSGRNWPRARRGRNRRAGRSRGRRADRRSGRDRSRRADRRTGRDRSRRADRRTGRDRSRRTGRSRSRRTGRDRSRRTSWRSRNRRDRSGGHRNRPAKRRARNRQNGNRQHRNRQNGNRQDRNRQDRNRQDRGDRAGGSAPTCPRFGVIPGHAHGELNRMERYGQKCGQAQHPALRAGRPLDCCRLAGHGRARPPLMAPHGVQVRGHADQ
jgi:hypothetical protein